MVAPVPAEFSIRSQVVSEQRLNTFLIAFTTRVSPAFIPVPRCEPMWNTTPSASIAQPTSTVLIIVATDFS